MNEIGALLFNSNRMMLGGHTERLHTTDRVSKLKSHQFIKLKLLTYNVRTLLRPEKLHQLTPKCKTLNLDRLASKNIDGGQMKKLQHWKQMGKNSYTTQQEKDLKEELDC